MTSYVNKARRTALVRLLHPFGDEERAILEMNRQVRAELTLKQEDGLAFRFRIPTRHMEVLRQVIPEFRTEQPRETQKRAWDWFLRDELSIPYRVKA